MSGMPCGECHVCEEELDFSDAGVCKTCGLGFHWNACGRWLRGEHCCDECANGEEEEA